MNHLRILWSGLWRMLIAFAVFVSIIGLYIWNDIAGIVFVMSVVFIGFSYMIGVLVHENDNRGEMK